MNWLILAKDTLLEMSFGEEILILASSLVMVSAIALAIVANNPTAMMAGPAALAQQQLRYSRIFEREADRFGFNNLIAAGYDPSSMGQMFENMAKVRKLAGDNPPEFLLTHPVTSSASK